LPGARTNTDFEFAADAASPDAECVHSEAKAGSQLGATFDLCPLLTTIVIDDQLSILGLKLSQASFEAVKKFFFGHSIHVPQGRHRQIGHHSARTLGVI
jgi:hypothetical protein